MNTTNKVLLGLFGTILLLCFVTFLRYEYFNYKIQELTRYDAKSLDAIPQEKFIAAETIQGTKQTHCNLSFTLPWAEVSTKSNSTNTAFQFTDNNSKKINISCLPNQTFFSMTDFAKITNSQELSEKYRLTTSPNQVLEEKIVNATRNQISIFDDNQQTREKANLIELKLVYYITNRDKNIYKFTIENQNIAGYWFYDDQNSTSNLDIWQGGTLTQVGVNEAVNRTEIDLILSSMRQE